MIKFKSALGDRQHLLASYSVSFIEHLFRDCKTVYLHDYPITIHKNGWNSHYSRKHLIKGSKKCAMCGIEGNIYVLECGEKHQFAFSLYHKRIDGQFILMTCDHIIPKSKGGNDSEINLQTLCAYCNNKKGSRIIREFLTDSLVETFFPLGIKRRIISLQQLQEESCKV